MFRDPYSERQEFYSFLSKNKFFISLAVILAVVAAAELALLFRMPRPKAGAAGAAGTIAAADPAPAAGVAGLVDDKNISGENAPGRGAPEGDWRLVLVNETHPLPEDFEVRLTTIRNDVKIDERILDPYNRMIEAARSEGLVIVAASAYRSLERQKELYDNKVSRLRAQGLSEAQAKAEAVREVAYPGTSEHHLGLALDLVAYRYQRLDEGQAETEENRWLQAHCREYGFILRYPEGKSEITGVIYEPWHFRYVGMEAAGEIMAQGICLEEYWEMMKK